MVVAGTGHRPEKLIVDGRTAHDPLVLERVTALAVAALRHYSPESVIAGGALGFDEALARAALETGYPLRLFLPFPGYDARWPREARERYAMLRAQAQEVHFVTPDEDLPGYDVIPRPPLHYGVVASLLDKRNRAMVDGSQLLLALWNGERKGGTWNCVRYAQKVDRKVRSLWPSWERHAALPPKVKAVRR